MADNGKRSRLAGGLVVLSLIVLSAILLLSLNALAWPFAGLSSPSPDSTVSSPQGNLTVILGSITTVIPGQNSSIEHPVEGVRVTVTLEGSSNALVDSTTSASGIVEAALSPSIYSVDIGAAEFNLTVNLQVIAKETTTLHAVLNETDYPASAFDLVDSDHANYVGEWNEVFAKVQTNGSIPTSGASTYLRFFKGSSFSIGNVTVVPINNSSSIVVSQYVNTAQAIILSSSKGVSSQWLQLKLPHFFSVDGVTGLEVFTREVTYTVNTVAN